MNAGGWIALFFAGEALMSLVRGEWWIAAGCAVLCVAVAVKWPAGSL